MNQTIHLYSSIFFALGQVGFEPTANRLKAEYSTTELLTRTDGIITRRDRDDNSIFEAFIWRTQPIFLLLVKSLFFFLFFFKV